MIDRQQILKMDRLGLNQGDDKYDLLALYNSWVSNFSNTMSYCE